MSAIEPFDPVGVGFDYMALHLAAKVREWISLSDAVVVDITDGVFFAPLETHLTLISHSSLRSRSKWSKISHPG